MTFDIITFQQNTIDDLDINQKYMIVGVRKSGTQSLKAYLLSKGYDVECNEGRFTIQSQWESHDYTRQPIILIRDCIERAWSDYEYFKNDDPPTNPNGLTDALEPSKYKKYLIHWKNPIVLTLGYLKTLDGFPIRNNNPNKASIKKEDFETIANTLNYQIKYEDRE